jgi:hypothetical protein
MVVKFSKQNSNYIQQNIIDILQTTVPDKKINKLANDKNDNNYIKIIGDIHRSQMTIDNPYGLFWFKIKAYEDGKELYLLSAVHIYVCFRLMKFIKKKNGYFPGECIIPYNIPGTDLPDISRLVGHWEFAKITYTH